MTINTVKKNTAKKGITAVVAVVLLLMMTVAAAGLAYMWISQMQSGTQEKTNAQLDAQQENMQGALSIDSIWADGTNTNFTIRNIGTTTMDLTKAKIYQNGSVVAPSAPTTLPSTFAPTDSITIRISRIFPGVGKATEIKVVSDNGVTTTKKCSITTASQTYC